jgi:hypothetical protein
MHKMSYANAASAASAASRELIVTLVNLPPISPLTPVVATNTLLLSSNWPTPLPHKYLQPRVKVPLNNAAQASRVPTASPTTCDTVAINSGRCRCRIEMQTYDMNTATVPQNGSIPQNNLVANLDCDSAALCNGNRLFHRRHIDFKRVPREYMS